MTLFNAWGAFTNLGTWWSGLPIEERLFNIANIIQYQMYANASLSLPGICAEARTLAILLLMSLRIKM
ncbi:MAG TPA: hypothetical protein VIJ75_21240 [Hanamia sp.]